ncbi:MAG: DUF5723 family protein [Bacteroidota bacterium]
MYRKIVKHFRKFLLLLLLIAYYSDISAQDSYTLYYLKNVPQSSRLNASYIPNFKYYVGFPLLSMWNVGAENNAFSYHDLIHKRADDSLIFDQNNVLNGLSKNNLLSFEVHDEILAFGFHVGKRNWLQLGLNQNIIASYGYTSDFLKLILKGNAQFIGKTIDITGNSLNATFYHDVSLSFARKINNNISAGFRVKYLIGIANIYSEKSKVTLSTDETTFALTGVSDVLEHTSYPDSKNLNTSFYGRNHGWAFDIGAQYQLNDKFSFSASVVDLFGSIKWKENPRTFQSKNPNSSFSFEGFNIDSLVRSNAIQQDYMNNFLDSIKNTFDIKETNQSYTSKINTKLYLAGFYNLTPKDIFGVMLRNEFIPNTFKPSVTLSYNRDFGKNFGIAVTYSIHNHTYTNFGLGLNGNIGPIQLYAISDNLYGLIMPLDTKKTNITFGINLVFGKSDAKKAKIRKDPPLFDSMLQ